MREKGQALRGALVAAVAGLLVASPLAAGQASGPDAAELADPPRFAADMDSGLVELALAKPSRVDDVARDRQLRLRGERVVVEVQVPPGAAARAREAIGDAGGAVVGGAGLVLQAAVPVDALRELGREPAVGYLRTPLPSLPDAVTGEGVALTGAAVAHAHGFTGAGVQVTVMDVGFAGYASSVAAGDLPAGLPTLDLCANINSTSHGTQVAEIVHEMAPAAQLSLVCTDTASDTQPGANFAKAQGADVISRSLGDPGDLAGRRQRRARQHRRRRRGRLRKRDLLGQLGRQLRALALEGDVRDQPGCGHPAGLGRERRRTEQVHDRGWSDTVLPCQMGLLARDGDQL